MKKFGAICAFLFVLCTLLIACGDDACEHIYDNTCDTDCNECGETRDVGAHDFSEGDCILAKTCKICGATEGKALGHAWEAIPDANMCQFQFTCLRCGAKDGKNVEHSWLDATCTAPKTCDSCGATQGDPLGHDTEEDDGNCLTPIVCPTCNTILSAGKTEHVPKADDGDCSTSVKCSVCDTVIMAAKTHDFNNAQWNSDKDGHWNVCNNENCVVAGEKVGHVSDGVPTEEKAEKCTVCNYTITPQLLHEHAYTVFDYDETGHWLECVCGEMKVENKTDHTAIDDRDCTTADICDCGYTVTPAKNHEEGEDDGNCTTLIKCTVCGMTVIAGNKNHVDADKDHLCDSVGCQISVDVPEDENEGIDLPIDKNN